MAKSVKLQEVAIDLLKPYGQNAKIHPQEQVEKIIKSIEEFGFITPCVIDADYNIIVGHGRVMASKQMGLEKVPCVFVEGLTEAQRRAYILADNRLGELGEWDMNLVFGELDDLADMDFDIEVTGFEVEASTDWYDVRERNDTSRQEGNEEYNEFLDKFEVKKTTDDCYTPDSIYNALADWVEKEYGESKEKFIRPFYPNGDYRNEKYKEGDVVVDNPPFSILSEILRFYVEQDIKFFLFAPTLTLFSGRGLEICYLPIGVAVTYENGAKVNTSFITNLEKGLRIKTSSELYQLLKEADDLNQKETRKELPSYEYPPELVTSASLSRLSVHGVDFCIPSEDCYRVTELDAMKESGKAIFGGGFLLSEKYTKKNAEAVRQIDKNDGGTVVWRLSERERDIVRSLGSDE